MKKKRWKSVFAGALTAAMVCNMGLASMAWAEPEEDAGTSLPAWKKTLSDDDLKRYEDATAKFQQTVKK